MDNSLIQAACKELDADKFSKKLSYKDHFATVLYCIFTRCTSICDVVTGLELCQDKLNHIHLKKVPPSSTLVFVELSTFLEITILSM
jgi:hypothetical protein